MSTHAKGQFDVKLTPQAAEDGVGHPSIGRLGLFKQFHGDIEGVAHGQMLGVRTAVEGSAGYVAIDHVEASVHGRRGTFVLQHSGTMRQGQMSLVVTVVPDSGTDELTGLRGRLDIQIVDGKHYYDFAYELPSA
ncbi:DUF3224 domain-containing protein [Arenimonas oryziterrae]|nr:DUF3224 domain-containing protein [Arenimonas oryziterrae]